MNIYQLKITLQHIKPPIWRRIQIAENTPLDELHEILQVVMGWENCHLHQFIVNKVCYGAVDPDFPDDIRDEYDVPMNRIAHSGGTLIYEYDFGDGWEHTINVEKVLATEKDQHYPLCLAGERACPPEDCGGFPGYQNLCEVLGDPGHEDYEDMLVWMGEDLDTESFDLVETNKLLQRLR